MMSPTNDPILKNLTIIYWHTLRHSNWKVALQAVEQQIKYATLLEKQIPSSQPPSKAMSVEEMTEPRLKDFVADLEKLYPELKELDPNLKHPPPAPA
jgi:hypothetical protein